MKLRRSQLFVPGHDERKIRKSIGLDADSIILDLEDAVPVSEKSKARLFLSELLPKIEWPGREICLRINKIGPEFSAEDIEFAKSQEKIDAIVLPKTEHIPASLRDTTGKRLIPLIETSMGFLRIEEIARTEGVEAITYGPADFAFSVRGKTEFYSQNNYVKTKIAVTASAYGLDAIDGVYFDLTNLEGFRQEALISRGLGFEGKQVVHPSQIEVANEVYSPWMEEILDAKKVVVEYEKSAGKGSGAFRMEGMKIEAVHYRAAKSLLERSELTNRRAKR